MRKGKVTLGIAAAAFAAVIAGAAVQASFNDAGDMRDMLVPTGQHPAAELIDSEVSLRELGKSTAQLPWGMVWSSSSCHSYLAEAVPGLYESEGWVRSTDRKAALFSQDRHYTELVARVPGGVDLNKVRAAAANCGDATLTLDGKVTGTVSYTEVAAPAVAGAEVLSLQITVSFPAAKDAESKAILAKYGYGTDAAEIIKKENIVVAGETLFTVLSPDAAVADAMAGAFIARTR